VAKIIFSALLRSRREGVQAEVAEFPDIKVSSWSVPAASLSVQALIDKPGSRQWEDSRTDESESCAPREFFTANSRSASAPARALCASAILLRRSHSFVRSTASCGASVGGHAWPAYSAECYKQRKARGWPVEENDA
jgi:hypothetical protein